jgi:tetratricopeptide (TPR) repeat protein
MTAKFPYHSPDWSMRLKRVFLPTHRSLRKNSVPDKLFEKEEIAEEEAREAERVSNRIKSLTEHIELDPNDAEAYFERSALYAGYHDELSSYDPDRCQKAIRDFETAMEIDPTILAEYRNEEKISENYFVRTGHCYRIMGKDQEALDVMGQI